MLANTQTASSNHNTTGNARFWGSSVWGTTCSAFCVPCIICRLPHCIDCVLAPTTALTNPPTSLQEQCTHEGLLLNKPAHSMEQCNRSSHMDWVSDVPANQRQQCRNGSGDRKLASLSEVRVIYSLRCNQDTAQITTQQSRTA